MAIPIPISKRRRSHGVEKSLSDAFSSSISFSTAACISLYSASARFSSRICLRTRSASLFLPLEISYLGLFGTLSILANNITAGVAQRTSMYLQTCPVFATESDNKASSPQRQPETFQNISK